MGWQFSILRHVFLVFLCVFTTTVNAATDDFPVPDSLRPAIGFWVRVYTEIDTDHGFLHDPRNLDVVYATLERDSGLIRRTRESIKAGLEVLASGKREGLSDTQQRLLEMWPADVSNARLAQAARNIRWQLGQSDRFIAGLQRSGAYRAHIEEVVRSKGMPVELAALPHVESSFHPGAYSSAAATGMWQFVRATAQRFMQVDYVVDQRLDPFEATYGAMELLQFNHNALGTWPLALTAYNHGANGMARAVRDTGTTDIGTIVASYQGRRFGFASRNFYAQFLAALEVESREQEFFGTVPRDPRPLFDTIELPDYIEPSVLAAALGVSENSLQRSNPALQPAVWSGTKRIPEGYRLKVERNQQGADLVAALNTIPGSQRFDRQIPDTSYTVRSGDSLSVIASRYSISISELVAINQLRNRNRIRVGQTLLLPQQGGAALALDTTPRPVPDTGEYQVASGDTLAVIALRYRVSEANLLAWNTLSDPNRIYPGQLLKLKPDSGQQLAVNTELTTLASELPAGASVQVARADAPGTLQTDVFEGPDVSLPEVLGSLEAPEPSQVAMMAETDDTAQELSEALLQAEEEQQLLVDLASDPADYTVDARSTIEIQAAETLGHYAEWLDIRAWDLRRLNDYAFRRPVIIGERLTLSFDKVDRSEFERRRQAYHRDLQQNYFARWRIKGTETYAIKSGDAISLLANRRDVPFWLFRQYNPAVESNRISIGQEVVFPIVEAVSD